MSAVDHNPFGTRSFHVHTTDFGFARLKSWIDRQVTIRQTERELRFLSDQELADIGIHRSEIRRIARQAV